MSDEIEKLRADTEAGRHEYENAVQSEVRDAKLRLRADALLDRWLAAHPAHQPAAGGDVEMPQIIAFLLGEDTFSGYWFGEAPPGEGRYWWRRHLREHFSASARAGDGGGDSILVRAKETK